jgi:hypothetical protein
MTGFILGLEELLMPGVLGTRVFRLYQWISTMSAPTCMKNAAVKFYRVSRTNKGVSLTHLRPANPCPAMKALLCFNRPEVNL